MWKEWWLFGCAMHLKQTKNQLYCFVWSPIQWAQNIIQQIILGVLVQSPSEIKPSKSIQLQTFRPKLSKLVQTCNVMCSRSNDRFWNSSIPFQSPFPAAPFLAISSFGLRLWAKAREKNKYCNLYLRYLWGDTENSLWMLNVRMSIGSSCSEGTAYWEMSPRINIL